ncbi:valine--tRNA ligase, mitochondrial-like [Diachasmimorpha longicaudata]|uniref:valine--tRNA ligase, mitochondrial-like n=1 Tax=Diachasmimorpha longicaudata TaxID=58733 RepID=UPI0030B8CB14
MNVTRLKELRKSVTLCRSYCYKLNEARVADFPTTYDTRGVQEHWDKIWKNNAYFTPKNDSASFRMILPPPNVTGVLHLGHALTVTIQDVLARWHRMRGDSVLWVPGLDHAGIATQAAVEKYLFATKGITRKQMGKEELLSAIQEWKTTKGTTIVTQLKCLGASLDWSREYFTMSKEHNAAVTEAFITLNERNLLYRKKDLVNWSPALQSTISDMEVELLEVSKRTEILLPGYQRKIPFGEMVEVAFQVKNSDEEVVIATTRVESMLGDAALAVHPEDARYSHLIGKEVFHPLRECFIPVIADLSVRRDFGTGVLKITPAHDRLDLEIGRKHNLELIEVINEDGTMNDRAKSFKGLQRFIARQKILDHLADKGLLRAVKDHPMVIPLCSRSGDVVEYLIKEQWFVRTQKMAEKLLAATKNNLLRIEPGKLEELWIERLENTKDWCVSRQLWWGHRIPAFKCSNSSETRWIVARTLSEAQEIASKFGSGWDVQQDEDVLDTWFSAGLLPLSAMGWPRVNCRGFYPLSLMETGHDIMSLWVARMAMLCDELTGQLPFEEVLLHGVLCDAQGKKMSKSLGNVINPEYVIDGISLEELNKRAQESFDTGVLSKSELKRTLSVNSKTFPGGIPECGVDALRFTLCAHNIKSDRISFNVIECKTNKHFCNKIWQACRYVLLVTDDGGIEQPTSLSAVDQWILSKMELMVERVNQNFAERNFYRAVNAVRQFFYYEFCDFYLEATKFGLKNGDKDTVEGHKWTLGKCLEVSLRVLAPVMPYLSEDLYSRLGRKLPGFLDVPSLMEAPYPRQGEVGQRNEVLEQRFEDILRVVTRMRNILSQVSRKSLLEVHVVLEEDERYQLFAENINFIVATTRVPNLKIVRRDEYIVGEESVCHEEADCKLYFVLSDKQVEDQMKKKILSM